MKKSLIALAVLGLSGAAMAQSSVTLYGIADAGVGKIEVPGKDGNNKVQFVGHSLVNNRDSRLGVRGVEDLGGGLRAGFNFETGLDLGDGAADANFWQRGANVWLSGGFGTVRLGRQYVPGDSVATAVDILGEPNYSARYVTFQALGLGPRTNSAFAYMTPNMGGLNASVAYVTKYDAGLSKAAYDAAVWYTNGPLAAGVSANKLGDSKTNYQVGAKYMFGGFDVAASYLSASQPDSKAVRRGFDVGVLAKFGAFSLGLDLTRDTKNEWTGKKYTNGTVEAKYALSKRTFVYGAFLRLDGTDNYGIGVRHNF